MLKSIAKKLIVGAGLPGFVRSTRSTRLRILMYHRFHGPKDAMQSALERQCRHLRKHYQLMTLSEIGDILASRRLVPPSALAVTVDDGYADFAGAWSVFRSMQIPVTLYVVSGFIDRKLWLWPDEVQYTLRETLLERLELTLPSGARYSRSLQDGEHRASVEAELCQLMITMPNADRLQALSRLREAIGVAVPEEIPEAFAPLSWEALRTMSREGLEIGAHTVNHPLLARLASPAEMQQEVAGSRDRIHDATGVIIQHFCYPNGQAADYTERSKGIVREAGFLTAVNARRGTNHPGQDRFDLFRVGCDPYMPFSSFELEVAGFRMP